jgi:NTE family protein
MPAKRLENAVSSLIDDVHIEDLPITFAALASDLISGKGVVIRKGSLRKAVVASSSIPGFFPPVKWNNHLLVDGEATDLIPVDACRYLGADFVIAVDVRRDLEQMSDLRHTIDIFLRSARITGYRHAELSLKRANFVIRPISEDIQWSEFDKLNELISAGEWVARACLPQLHEALNNEDAAFMVDEYFPESHIILKAPGS